VVSSCKASGVKGVSIQGLREGSVRGVLASLHSCHPKTLKVGGIPKPLTPKPLTP
jgi:hypothetical protein